MKGKKKCGFEGTNRGECEKRPQMKLFGKVLTMPPLFWVQIFQNKKENYGKNVTAIVVVAAFMRIKVLKRKKKIVVSYETCYRKKVWFFSLKTLSAELILRVGFNSLPPSSLNFPFRS